MNIDGFISEFLSLMYRGVSFAFSFLERFKFSGTNLLVYIITLEVLSVVIGIVLTTVKRKNQASARYAKRKSSKEDKGDSDD